MMPAKKSKKVKKAEKINASKVKNVDTANIEEVDNANSDNNVNPKDKINSIIAKKENLIKILERYANTSGSVTRKMLTGLPDKVNLYHELNELEKDLEKLHTEWLATLTDPDIESLETGNDPLSPSLFSSMFEESGKVIDSIVSVFKTIKDTHPDNQDVINHLDFIDKPLKNISLEENLFDVMSVSVTSGKGEDYAKIKIPEVMNEVNTNFGKIREKFENGEIKTKHNLDQTIKYLEKLEAKIDDKSRFEGLL